MVPKLRIRAANESPVRAEGEYVLYWMVAFRRLDWNFSLDRAIEWAEELRKPLVVLEALRIGYPWASDRLHAFVLDGVRENLRRSRGDNLVYYPYLESEVDAGEGLLTALAERAAVVVTDDFPCFFIPRMIAATAKRVPARLEAVDGNGLLPLRAADRVFQRAFDFRRFLQRELPEHLGEAPKANPVAGAAMESLDPQALRPVRERWPALTEDDLLDPARLVSGLAIDHRVPIVATRGGSAEGECRWREFLDHDLSHYAAGRNDPDADASSRLSAYLHFGHLSSHQVFHELAERERWTPMALGPAAKGQRSGWWGMSAAAEAFLDQLVTWRELGLNMSSHTGDYDRFESLPDWSRRTIDEHRDDPRPVVYSAEELECGATHDPIWNAAQGELRREGRIHNYLRMLWGKKIFEWSARPEDALAVMIHLNNKYALDGRDPNSYSGIFWCLGRYDRAWGPERSIFGKIRYMSSESARRKLRLEDYVRRFGGEGRMGSAEQESLFDDL